MPFSGLSSSSSPSVYSFHALKWCHLPLSVSPSRKEFFQLELCVLIPLQMARIWIAGNKLAQCRAIGGQGVAGKFEITTTSFLKLGWVEQAVLPPGGPNWAHHLELSHPHGAWQGIGLLLAARRREAWRPVQGTKRAEACHPEELP